MYYHHYYLWEPWCHFTTSLGNTHSDTTSVNRKKKINHLMSMDITPLVKNEKELETLIHTVKVYSQNFRKGMWHRKICHFSNEQWQTKHNGRRRTTKLSSHQNVRRKGSLQILGDIANWHHQTTGNKIKSKKRESQKSQKNTREKTL